MYTVQYNNYLTKNFVLGITYAGEKITYIKNKHTIVYNTLFFLKSVKIYSIILSVAYRYNTVSPVHNNYIDACKKKSYDTGIELTTSISKEIVYNLYSYN